MERAHASPAFPPSRLAASRKVGSASMAILGDSFKAVMNGFTLVAVARKTTFLITSGSIITHSSAWNPPIEGPIIMSILSMPRCFRTRMLAFTMSRTVVLGKSNRKGFPVEGLMEAGLLDPYGEQSMLTQTT